MTDDDGQTDDNWYHELDYYLSASVKKYLLLLSCYHKLCWSETDNLAVIETTNLFISLNDMSTGFFI